MQHTKDLLYWRWHIDRFVSPRYFLLVIWTDISRANFFRERATIPMNSPQLKLWLMVQTRDSHPPLFREILPILREPLNYFIIAIDSLVGIHSTPQCLFIRQCKCGHFWMTDTSQTSWWLPNAAEQEKMLWKSELLMRRPVSQYSLLVQVRLSKNDLPVWAE